MDMSRVEKSKEAYKKFFGSVVSEEETDPDFQNLKKSFIFGEIYSHGNLDDKTRQLITLVVLTASQTLEEIQEYTKAALNIGLEPEEIKEAIYQCTPYIGFSKTEVALKEVNRALKICGISLPVQSQSTTTEESRFEKGLSVQQKIFGVDHINTMRANAPEELKHIQDYLSAMCFGDFYTRDCLDLKIRELLTFCVISTLGGCENQVKAHVQGNVNVGNDKQTLIAAITQCLPFIGFPRTLNAISCINAII